MNTRIENKIINFIQKRIDRETLYLETHQGTPWTKEKEQARISRQEAADILEYIISVINEKQIRKTFLNPNAYNNITRGKYNGNKQ